VERDPTQGTRKGECRRSKLKKTNAGSYKSVEGLVEGEEVRGGRRKRDKDPGPASRVKPWGAAQLRNGREKGRWSRQDVLLGPSGGTFWFGTEKKGKWRPQQEREGNCPEK